MKENFDKIFSDSKIKQNGFALNEKYEENYFYLKELRKNFKNPPRSLITLGLT